MTDLFEAAKSCFDCPWIPLWHHKAVNAKKTDVALPDVGLSEQVQKLTLEESSSIPRLNVDAPDFLKNELEKYLSDDCRKDPEKLVDGLQQLLEESPIAMYVIFDKKYREEFAEAFFYWLRKFDKNLKQSWIRDHEGNMPLHCAVRKRYYVVCHVLLSLKARVYRVNNHGHSPFFIANENNDVVMLKYLMRSAGDLLALCIDGLERTSLVELHKIISQGNVALWIKNREMISKLKEDAAKEIADYFITKDIQWYIQEALLGNLKAPKKQVLISLLYNLQQAAQQNFWLPLKEALGLDESLIRDIENAVVKETQHNADIKAFNSKNYSCNPVPRNKGSVEKALEEMNTETTKSLSGQIKWLEQTVN